MLKLRGESVYLRAIEPEDSEIIYNWENNTDIWQVSDTLVPYSRFTIDQYVNSIQDIYVNKQLRLIICENETSAVIGAIDIFDFNPFHSRAGIGILIADNQHRKKGFASQALSLAIDYCFTVLMLNQIYCNIPVENEDSLNLFLRYDFQIVGIMKNWNKTLNGFADEYFLQLLNYHLDT